jgi:predicted regulator of Ras-like GTPase activity (Roadblock/LC7/MglB family)
MTKGEELKGHIETLRNALPELKGIVLASNDGLPIAYPLSNCEDSSRLAVIASALSKLGRRISDSIGMGVLCEVSVQAAEGALFAYSAGPQAVLVVITHQVANVGWIHLKSRSAAKEIADLFQPDRIEKSPAVFRATA